MGNLKWNTSNTQWWGNICLYRLLGHQFSSDTIFYISWWMNITDCFITSILNIYDKCLLYTITYWNIAFLVPNSYTEKIYHSNNVLTVLYILYCDLALGSKTNLLVLLLNGLARSRKSLHRKPTNSLLLFNCNRKLVYRKPTN